MLQNKAGSQASRALEEIYRVWVVIQRARETIREFEVGQGWEVNMV